MAIEFTRTRDARRIRELVAGDARMWHAATDDGVAGGPEAYRPHQDPRVWYVVARDVASDDLTQDEDEQARPYPRISDPQDKASGRDVALLTLLPQNSVCYELHINRAFGRGAAQALREIFGWAFENTPARRIVASIPADNPIAIRAARRSGMKPYGINPASYARGGQLHDQILFGVSASCHQ